MHTWPTVAISFIKNFIEKKQIGNVSLLSQNGKGTELKRYNFNHCIKQSKNDQKVKIKPKTVHMNYYKVLLILLKQKQPQFPQRNTKSCFCFVCFFAYI